MSPTRPPAATAMPPPQHLVLAAPYRFPTSDVVPCRLADAATKARFATQFTRFVSAGLPAQQYPTWFHRLLVHTFGLPRHATRGDLLSRWFVSDAARAEFVRRVLAHAPDGRPERTFADVELSLQHWLTTSGAATEILLRSERVTEAAERQLLRCLLDRYPDERERRPAPRRAPPVQHDLFPDHR